MLKFCHMIKKSTNGACVYDHQYMHYVYASAHDHDHVSRGLRVHSLFVKVDFTNVWIQCVTFIVIPPIGFVVIVVPVRNSKTAILNATRAFTTFPACEIEWGSVNPPPISLVIWVCSSQPEIVARTTVQTSNEIVLHLWPTGSEVRRWMNLRATILGFNPVRRVKDHPVTAGLIPCPSLRALWHIVGGGCRACRCRCHRRCRCWRWCWSAWLEVASLAEGGYFLTVHVLVSSKINNLKNITTEV